MQMHARAECLFDDRFCVTRRVFRVSSIGRRVYVFVASNGRLPSLHNSVERALAMYFASALHRRCGAHGLELQLISSELQSWQGLLAPFLGPSHFWCDDDVFSAVAAFKEAHGRLPKRKGT